MRQSKKDAVRLNKLISESGFCSRREADLYIEQERVTVNSHTAKAGDKVYRTDFIKIDGEPLRFMEKPVFEKPKREFASKRITRNLGISKSRSSDEKESKTKKGHNSSEKEGSTEVQAKKVVAAGKAVKSPAKEVKTTEGAAKRWFSGRKRK